jgi:hypothetical protein
MDKNTYQARKLTQGGFSGVYEVIKGPGIYFRDQYRGYMDMKDDAQCEPASTNKIRQGGLSGEKTVSFIKDDRTFPTLLCKFGADAKTNLNYYMFSDYYTQRTLVRTCRPR